MTDPNSGAQADSTGAASALTDAIKLWTSVMPDLSKVPAPTLTAETTPPLFADLADYEALRHVAEKLAGDVADQLGEKDDVDLLVTNDTTLAVSDSLYRGIREQLRDLLAQAQTLNPPAPPADDDHDGAEADFVGPADAIGAAVAAIPDILTVLSPQRTISTSSSSSGDDLAVASAVIGHLRKARATWRIDYDSIRLLPTNSQLLDGLRSLNETQATLTNTANALPDGTRKTLITTLLGEITVFQTAINLIPSGATSSPLTTALMREQLDAGTPGDAERDHVGIGARFTHVLVASTRNTSASGSTQHHLIGKEQFTTVGAITVAYFLLHVVDRQLISAGTITQTATVSGDINGALQVQLAGGEPVQKRPEAHSGPINETRGQSKEPARSPSPWRKIPGFLRRQRPGSTHRAVTAGR